MGVQGAVPPAGARGVPASFPFPKKVKAPAIAPMTMSAIIASGSMADSRVMKNVAIIEVKKPATRPLAS